MNDRAAEGHVLVCDDDETVLRAYTRALRRKGFQVSVADSGEAAMALIESTPFDAVLSDIAMPAMDGVDLLRNIRARSSDVPVVLMTGHATVDTAIEALEWGAAHYLRKPVDPDTLVAALTTAIARRTRGQDASLGDLRDRFEAALRGLWMAFQPICSATNSGIYAYEALVRTEEESLKNPVALLGAAERLGETHRLSRKIRATVAGSLFAAPPDARIFVNLHPHDLLDEELYDPDAPLSRVADRVTLEITERATLESITNLRSRMFALRNMGYEIAIDDLGAGYAGLSTLARVSPDVVKIDRALTSSVHLEPMNQRVVRSIVELCRQSDIVVIAEGIETEAEREVMLRLGCTLQQGYYYARPAGGFPAIHSERNH